ncbi:MAG: hypothetical protein ABIH46_12220, partial [Chloroflexota bacterium]
MAITHHYTYLGEIKGPGLGVPQHLYLGQYTAAAGDAYPKTTTKINFVFSGLSQVTQVLNLWSDLAANVAN